jgi:hypothetical protein
VLSVIAASKLLVDVALISETFATDISSPLHQAQRGVGCPAHFAPHDLRTLLTTNIAAASRRFLSRISDLTSRFGVAILACVAR